MQCLDGLHTLSVRIERLEKSNRRHRIVGMALTLLALLIFATGARKEKRVRAGGFELRDPTGRLRVEIALDSRGSPFLNLLDPNERVRTILGIDELGNPSLEFHDSNGRERLVMGLDEEQDPVVNLLDEDGLTRASLGFENNKKPSFWLGNNIRNIHLSAGDDSRIAMTDSSGKEQLLLRGQDRGSTVVQVNRGDQSAVLDHERLIFVKGTAEVWASPSPPAQAQ